MYRYLIDFNRGRRYFGAGGYYAGIAETRA